MEQSLEYYLERFASGHLTPAERLALQKLIDDPANENDINRILDSEWPRMEESGLDFPRGIERLHQAVAKAIHIEDEISMPSRTTHRVRFLRSWRWAAAVIVLLCGGLSISSLLKKQKQSISVYKPAASTIQPGNNRAILSIDDKAIDLAVNQSGIMVKDVIRYSDGEKLADAGQMLQLTTPRGGQYQAVLPDGTKVWLNAASSIRFPSRFTGDRRIVELTGEVYVEVAKNLKQPFSVNVSGTTIEVLGTNFNVNAYDDENSLKTTLIDGAIRITAQQLNSKSVILKPGQQAVIASGNKRTVEVNNNADIEQTLAWRNGLFNFKGLPLSSMLRQLERWYDITIDFKGRSDDILMNGKMDRGVQLSDVIRFLQSYGFETRLEGRKLVIIRK